jgi:hypothetical protein
MPKQDIDPLPIIPHDCEHCAARSVPENLATVTRKVLALHKYNGDLDWVEDVLAETKKDGE